MYNNSPTVSVICLCHNQAKYVQAAIDSIVTQTYRPLELIVVDDGSCDDSVQKIQQKLQHIPSDIVLKTVFIDKNIGNCKAFNRGLALATGEFVIDHAADDLLLPMRIAEQVAAFCQAPPEVGVVFSDVWLADENGTPRRTFYRRNRAGKLLEKVPSGNLYIDLLHRYCVCAPTMMMRRSVLLELGGYDETLSYEDYDFWVRSARRWQYWFVDSVSTVKRELPRSHGKKIYQRGFSLYRNTTLQVCRKAAALNCNTAENEALARMIRYQMRLCLRTGDWTNLRGFYELLQQINLLGMWDKLVALPILFTRLC
ncbi:MAG: glycosyltransferase [Cytophagales bacterium]|nr:glycosyltransferase [Bernardetiaceae bacterium]MDW8203663.1 glycosyltransferase [Cytophagales bacterium]